MARLVLGDDGDVVLDYSEDPALEPAAIIHLKMGFGAKITGPSRLSLGALRDFLPHERFLASWAKKARIALQMDAEISSIQESTSAPAILNELRAKAKTFRFPLRNLLPHQQRTLEHAVGVGNEAVFSVPGSGKTAIALALWETLRSANVVSSLAVIGPAASFDPWEEEFEACFGRPPTVVRLIGSPDSRRASLQKIDDVEMILSTYQMANRERTSLIDVFRKRRWLLVLDESHNIKRYTEGVWSESILEIAPFAARRVILTGTPAPRSLLDIWTQFTFLWPSQRVLGSRIAFEGMQTPDKANELRDRISPFFYRTRKEELNLPPYRTIPYVIQREQWPSIQRDLMNALETATLRESRAIYSTQRDLALLSRWRKARIIRMLQAASNPALLRASIQEFGIEDEPDEGGGALENQISTSSALDLSAKLSFATELARSICQEGRKVVIWTAFVGNIDVLAGALEEFDPVVAYGGIRPFEDEEFPDVESRERNIRKFKTDLGTGVLVANPAACSESVSLHMMCHDAIYLDRTFNCAHFLQSMDRIHRVGLPAGTETRYHLPLLDCAIDRLVDQRLRQRQEAMYGLLSDGSVPVGGWSDGPLFDDETETDSTFRALVDEISRR